MSKSKRSNGNGNGAQRSDARAFEIKVGLAEMLKGGVIMDVTTSEQAKIAEDAGATAVMALERVPSDIRKEGGVARMCSIEVIEGIQKVVSIPVRAKVRIGHFTEARVLEALGVDFIDESEVLTPADEAHHVDKHAYRSLFVCGCRDLGEALRRISEGAAMIRTKGEASPRSRKLGTPQRPLSNSTRRFSSSSSRHSSSPSTCSRASSHERPACSTT